MTKAARKRIYTTVAVLSCVLVGNAEALGLGEIVQNSGLHEVLNARIGVTEVSLENSVDVRVALASAADFERAGIERPYALHSMKFVVAAEGDDGPIISVSSTRPITEPYLKFLIEVSWPQGRLLKAYTLLLNPPALTPRPG
jgi:pilus assembly protein FimV